MLEPRATAPRRLLRSLVPLAALALGALAAAVPAVVRQDEADPKPPLAVPAPGEGWKEVDRLEISNSDYVDGAALAGQLGPEESQILLCALDRLRETGAE